MRNFVMLSGKVCQKLLFGDGWVHLKQMFVYFWSDFRKFGVDALPRVFDVYRMGAFQRQRDDNKNQLRGFGGWGGGGGGLGGREENRPKRLFSFETSRQ